MTQQRDQPAPKPIGWWLKEADAAIDRAFDAALAGTGVDRRGWQVLASAGRGPVQVRELVAVLQAFDEPARVEAVVGDLADRGWLERREDEVRTTELGAATSRELAERVGAVRGRVVAALPGEDYATLVALLARLVEGLAPRGPVPAEAEGVPSRT